MSDILIRNAQYLGEIGDLIVTDRVVVRVGDYDRIIDATGLIAVPSFEDYHVHFRDPGLTEKEDLLSGARAAVAGGYALVRCEPNTRPVIDDTEGITRFIERAWSFDLPITVLTKCALTHGQRGEELVDIAGIRGRFPWIRFSSDGEPVTDRELLVLAFRAAGKASAIDLHCEETPHSAARVTAALGPGTPLAREVDLITLAISALADAGTGRLHIQHVSLAESARLIAKAKAQGLHITAEVAPHHLLLCAEEIPLRDGAPDANWKMNPPLRTREDMHAMRRALADGVIDFIATDHAPHTEAEKARVWDDAPFGVIGLETAFGACMTLVHNGELTFDRLIAVMTGNECPELVRAITLIDPAKVWSVDPDKFYSKGRNCPFAGWILKGKPVYTIAGGQVVMADGDVRF